MNLQEMQFGENASKNHLTYQIETVPFKKKGLYFCILSPSSSIELSAAFTLAESAKDILNDYIEKT